VQWYPWGDTALSRAKKEDKLILLSIGYAACHWCHVMEHESFEDENTAQLMNDNFINIKIDREERPDIDAIYMEAIQIISGSGGWPLNVFLTPELKPFYGGTYFPPIPAFNRPSWTQLLTGISVAWKERSSEIKKQAEEITSLIGSRNDLLNRYGQITKEKISVSALLNLKEQFDLVEGGIGSAPKFPSTFCMNFLMQYYFFSKDESALKQVCLSLDKMLMGGIYDQLGGGFSRYSTDEKWLVPHFEKMLYDNALLVHTYSEAFKLTGKKEYKRVIEETLEFIERELTNPEGGFYSSIDADSEGEEGKFYCWMKKDVDELLGENSSGFSEYYGITDDGNWEGKNILHLKENFQKKFSEVISAGRKKLFESRENRIRPSLDDKIILSWNAMTISAYANASKALRNDRWKEIAIDQLNFLLENLTDKTDEGSFHHNFKNGKASNPAFLDDYAMLIKSCIDVYELTFEFKWIRQAEKITKKVFDYFGDKEDSLFFFTSEKQKDVLLRKKEYFDNAVASGNSVMAEILHKLGLILDNKDWRNHSARMYERVKNISAKFSSSFGNWLTMITALENNFIEIALTGNESYNAAKELQEKFLPMNIIALARTSSSEIPLLRGKFSSGELNIYLCKNYSCQLPVKSVNEILERINGLVD